MNVRTRPARTVALLFGLAIWLCAVVAGAQKLSPGEAMLEGRLIAPCCWTQTLDIHESPLASELRAEIHDRLGRGERAEAIEDDLVVRYGEQIRAIPKGRDPRVAISVGSAAAMLVSAVGLLWLIRKWTRRPARAADMKSAPAGRDAYDDRLDDELGRFDAS